jgi:hypothetical protein
MLLKGGGALAYCWAFESHQYIIKSFRLEL